MALNQEGGLIGNPKILQNFSKLPTNILYDVIVAEDVIEHVTNPLKMISELFSL